LASPESDIKTHKVTLDLYEKQYNALTKTGSVALDSIIMCSNGNDGNPDVSGNGDVRLVVSDSSHIDKKSSSCLVDSA